MYSFKRWRNGIEAKNKWVKKSWGMRFRWWVYLVFVTFLREAMFVGDLITLFCFFFFSSGWWRFLGSCSFPFLMEGFPFIELTKLSLFIFVFLVHIFGTCSYTISISSIPILFSLSSRSASSRQSFSISQLHTYGLPLLFPFCSSHQVLTIFSHFPLQCSFNL